MSIQEIKDQMTTLSNREFSLMYFFYKESGNKENPNSKDAGEVRTTIEKLLNLKLIEEWPNGCYSYPSLSHAYAWHLEVDARAKERLHEKI